MHDLRISVTDRCNMRCTYCMPAHTFHDGYQFLPRRELLSFEELARVSRAAVALGVEKLRITGGEPLVRKDLPELIAMLRGIPGVRDLALTTNGLLLPEQARPLREAGLNRVTVSLDSLDDAVFGAMNGRGIPVAEVLEGIAAAEAAGLTPIKINVVVQKGVNDHTLPDLAAHFRGTGCIVRFIEFMDVGTRNAWKLDEVLPSRELLAQLHARFPLRPLRANYGGEVAERYAYEDGAGEIGFISSVTQPFCGGCTRLRLSSDGQLFTCLFSTHGHDLKQALRTGADDAALQHLIAQCWRGRADRYSELRGRANAPRDKVEMYHIGG